jgi:hypothetical protein
MVSYWFEVKDKAVNSPVEVGPVALDVVVVKVLFVVDVDEVIAGHEGLPPAMYLYASL